MAAAKGSHGLDLTHANDPKIKSEELTPQKLQVIVFLHKKTPKKQGTSNSSTIRPHPRSTSLSSGTPSATAKDGEASAFTPSVHHYSGETFGQPKVRLLPNLPQTYYWNPPDAWDQRAVIGAKIGAKDHRIFFTRAKEDLCPDEYMNALISSDIFVLKLSDATNPDGTWSYQDVLPNATKDRSDQFIQKVGECPWKLDGRRGCCLLECCIEPKALNGVEELER